MGSSVPSGIERADRLVALVGNPNTGKTTLFNALTGYRQRVANYPGVTVERKTGFIRGAAGGARLEAIDVPGAYSLAAHSTDEAVVLDVLLGREESTRPPDLIVCVLDAANLSRNLFLTSQVLEFGVPVVLALNMVDIAEACGIRIDVDALGRELGVPVVPVVATKRIGVDQLKRVIIEALGAPPSHRYPALPDCVGAELNGLSQSCCHRRRRRRRRRGASRVELLQSLLDPGGYHERRLIERWGPGFGEELAERRRRIAQAGESIAEVEGRVRYAWIEWIVERVVTHAHPSRRTRSEVADRFLTHRVLGLVVLVVTMAVCFQAIYSWAGPLTDAIEGGFGMLGRGLAKVIPAGALQSLVVNGVVAGVGAVLVFLPQILILFLFIAILEDCGYLARAAFLLDRLMNVLGLNGKSFIPLLSSFACAVPGILATRTIEDRRGRLLTILIAPLMSCSARLPVYTLFIAAFIPVRPLPGGLIGLQAASMLALYLVGLAAAFPVTLVLQRTLLRGAPQPFLMELPTYKWPMPRTVLYRMYERGKAFCVSAGTIIVAMTIVVWALGYYPHSPVIAEDHQRQRLAAREEHAARLATLMTQRDAAPDVARQVLAADRALGQRLAKIDQIESGSYLGQSVLGRMGVWIEPLVKPLGWDWRIGTAVIASFPAREVVIATMGTIYNLGSDPDEAFVGLREKLHASTWPDGSKVFNMPVALSIMVFFALCCQCGATLAVMKRETNSWRWPLLTFAYMTTLAYVAALVTYQVATRLV